MKTCICCLLSLMCLAIQAKPKKNLPQLSYPKLVEINDSARIRWEFNEKSIVVIQDITSGNIVDTLASSGDMRIKVTEPIHYKFIGTYKKDVVQKRCMINTFQPSISVWVPDSASYNEEITVSWTAGNADTIWSNLSNELLPAKGSFKYVFDTTTTVTFYAATKLNIDSVSQKITLKTETIDGKNSIFRGQTATYNWQLREADSVILQNTGQVLKGVDQIHLQPDSSTLLDLEVYRSYGDVDTIQKYLRVKSPYLLSFKCPYSAKKDNQFPISWVVHGTDSVYFNDTKVRSRDKIYFTIDTPTTVTLTFYDGDKPVVHSHKIKLLPSRKFVTHVDPTYTGKDSRLDCDIVAIDQSEYPDKVKLHVLVVDTMGNYVNNIAPPYNSLLHAKEYFTSVMENGLKNKEHKSFQVREFRADTTQHYNFALALDHSGSMSGIINDLQSAAKEFINHKYPRDKISVVKFDHNLTRNPLSDRKDTIVSNANFKGLKDFGGGTAMYAGADEGLVSIQNEDKNRVLILFTDGEDNTSFAYWGLRAFDPYSLAKNVQQSDTRFWVISYGDNVDYATLGYLAILGGGKYYHLSRRDDINNVFRELPRVIRHYYEITYTPNVHDGEHVVNLKFNDQKGKNITVEGKYFIGDFKEKMAMKVDTNKYWSRLMPEGSTMVAPTQTIANFDFDKSNLNIQYFKVADRFIAFMKENPDTRILLSGHTDTKGSFQYCQKLSEERCVEVKNYFLKNGISENRIITTGFGKSQPIWNNDTDAIKAHENRRVDGVLYSID